jgi:hypothetical protein
MFIVWSIPFFRHRQPVVLVTPRSHSHLFRLTSFGVGVVISIGFLPPIIRERVLLYFPWSMKWNTNQGKTHW